MAKTRAIVHADGDSACGWACRHRRQLCLAHVQRQAKAMRERGGGVPERAAFAEQLGGGVLEARTHPLWEVTACDCARIDRAVGAVVDLADQRTACASGTLGLFEIGVLRTTYRCRLSTLWSSPAWRARTAANSAVCGRRPHHCDPLARTGARATSNAAERALRSPVIWRKISFGNDTESGARCTERLLSVAETCRRTARCIRTLLPGALVAYRQRRKPPRLVPEPAT